jgi:hypothetical protein
MTPIHLRNLPENSSRGAETFDHPKFFEFLFKYLKPECYLEIGVRQCETFNVVAKYCKKAIGVDIIKSPVTKSRKVEFHLKSSDEYFKTLSDDVTFDVVFIDGDHSHEQSLKDFMNVKDRVIEDGFIFLHDTYPFDEKYITPEACGEVYKTAQYIKENLIDEFEILTLPINPGVTMIKKMKRNKQLIYKNEK